MFLRSRSVVRHSCSGLHTEAGWLLIRSESRERVNVFHQSPPPITMLTPDPSVCLRGRERGRNEGRGAALQEIKSMPWSKGREKGERAEQMCTDVQVERLRGKIITDRFSSYKVLLGDIVLRLIDVAPVYEHLGCKSVSATTKSPPDSAVWFCKTTSAFCCIYGLK